MVSSCLVRVEEVPDALLEEVVERDVMRWFVPESLAVARVVDGQAAIAADFRIDGQGHGRMAVLARPGIGRRRLGRIVQRLLEIETYKSMAMLTLPTARAWYAVRFTGDDSEIDISPPDHEIEFGAWRWAKRSELMDLVVPFKAEVYREVLAGLGRLAADL